MNTHIISQMHNDEKVEEKKDLIASVLDLYDIFVSTRNNEEDFYLNVEDERVGSEEKFLYSSEIGVDYYEKPILRIGACNREVFFKTTGAIQDFSKNSKDIDIHERNDLVKEQWLRKFVHAKLLSVPETGLTGEKVIRNINIKATEEAFIDDVRFDKTFTLLIKPVNDTAKSIIDQLWPYNSNIKPRPMGVHLPEAAMLLYFYKLPVKLLYVGKNNTEKFIEFNIGVKNGYLYINDEIDEGFKISYLFKNLEIMVRAYNMNLVPPRSYIRERVVSSEEIAFLRRYNFINDIEAKELTRGGHFKSYKCRTCKYEQLCDSLADDWVDMKG